MEPTAEKWEIWTVLSEKGDTPLCVEWEKTTIMSPNRVKFDREKGGDPLRRVDQENVSRVIRGQKRELYGCYDGCSLSRTAEIT